MLSTAGEPGAFTSRIPDDLPRGAKAGPWIVERELGRGGMGSVYAVVHDEIGKRAALKVVHGRLLGGGFNPDRMLVEARVVNQVGHPNIVDIFETGKLPDGRPYIVMERLEGQSLSNRVDAGPVSPELAIAILRQICDGLIAAHAAGIVHRDLKLDNVFLVDNLEEPSTPRVKILDWGIAKIVHEDIRHTVEGQLVGTPQYLAPEQARGAKVSPKTDVYSLGVLAYELFLDQLPFEAETPAEVMTMHLRAVPPPPSDFWPDIPASLEELLLEMLSKRPDDRPTMLEVANRLEAVRLDLSHRRASTEPPLGPTKPATLSKPIPVPQLPAHLSIDAARVVRRMSAEAHAPTRPAEWQRPTHHWRYVVGGLAILGCVALFLLTRSAHPAAASSPSATVETGGDLHASAPAAVPALPAQKSALEVAALPGAAAPVEIAASEPPAAPVAPKIVRQAPAKSAPASRPAPTARSPKGSTPNRRAPASPRRNAKIDPDGTIDPYR